MLSLWAALGIPPTQVPISLTTFLSYIIPPIACYFVAAILAITPQTRAIRVALWPIVALLAFRAALSVDMSHGKPERKTFNLQLLRIMFTIGIHSLSWAIAKKPLVRHLRPVNSSPSTIMDALDLVTTSRGHGWDWSRGLYVPRRTRSTHRTTFAFHALLSVITHLLLCLVLDEAIQTFTTDTGSKPTIVDDTLPLFVRHLRASIITILAAFITYCSLQMGYNGFALLGVLVFRQDPAQWPPAFDNPWCATSLSDFWGRRWHQWLRHMFLTCAYPLGAVFGRAGTVVGAFLVSGVMHYLLMLVYDGQSEMWRMLVPFGVMGPALLAERAFYKTTGKKVGGVVGWFWTMLWLVAWGNVITEGYVRDGMFERSSDANSQIWVVKDLVVRLDAWLHSV